MLKIAPYMMRSRLNVEPYEGSGAYGETYGKAKTIRAYVEPKRVLVRLADGAEVVSMLRVFCLPDAPIAAQSRATYGGKVYTVHESSIFEGSYQELLLKP